MGRTDYQQLFMTLLEAVPLAMFVIDRHMFVISANQPALRLCGSTALIPQTKISQLLHDDTVMQLVQETMQAGNGRCELYEKKDEKERTWKISVVPLRDQVQEVEPTAYKFFGLAIEDVTEARRLERMQRDFLANISHELRTPLTSVSLLAETLEDVIDTDPDRAQQFIEKIENEVQYLNGMVSELLELSRIESGQLPMNIEPVEAGLLVHEVLARMLPQAQRHRVRLTTNIQQGQVMVAADSKLIARVLVNLVHNAIKFTPSDGLIVIGTGTLTQQQMQRFYVRDTGVGIREEDLPRVFERFFKTNRSRSKDDFIGPGGGGTGLGLAIARQVIEAHDGRLKAESTQGQGSTFTFTLPIAVRLPLNKTAQQEG